MREHLLPTFANIADKAGAKAVEITVDYAPFMNDYSTKVAVFAVGVTFGVTVLNWAVNAIKADLEEDIKDDFKNNRPKS